jgi:hypothetical protein
LYLFIVTTQQDAFTHNKNIKAVVEKRMEFHTYKLKEGRRYKIVLEYMHYSTNPEEIITEIEKLGHMATNI